MSKLIELMIAADIKWPADAKFAVQNMSRALTFSGNQPVFTSGRKTWDCFGSAVGSSNLILPELASNWNKLDSLTNVKDYYLAGGWIQKGSTVSAFQGIYEFMHDDGFSSIGDIGDADWNRVTYFRIVPVKPIPITDGIPVVGQECEVIFNDDINPKWYQVKILFIGETKVMANVDGDEVSYDREYLSSDIVRFRPLRTEREKAIECLVTILKRFDCSPHEIAEALLDAGYHK